MQHFEITWFDKGREPQCPPNPDYPTGIDIDVTDGREPHCDVVLPYPAKRCGIYQVRCKICGYTVALTTAGRIDDPRTVRIPCGITSDA